MAIAAGRTLPHYRLIEKIGEGGTGEVWRAEDTTLEGEVAVEVLSDVFVEGPDRLTRSEREAKLLSSQSHHNIASIYGVHESNDTHLLAMELVPGEDLARPIFVCFRGSLWLLVGWVAELRANP